MRKFAAVAFLLLAFLPVSGQETKEEAKARLEKEQQAVQQKLDALDKAKQSAKAEEFGRGYIPLTPAQRAKFHAEARRRHDGHLEMLMKNQTLPSAFDCKEKGWVIPVGNQGSCVLPGSKVTMGDGSQKAIEDIRLGEKIMDIDGKVARVNWITKRDVDEEVVGIVTDASTLWLTAEHPVFIGSCETIPAGELKAKDHVYSVNTNYFEDLHKITRVERKRYAGKVYNLIVSRSKTYIVNGICVHNCGSCYLYSTSYGTLTEAFVKAGYGKPDGSLVMSVQYGMDRPRNFGGCNGGNGTEVIDWVMKNGWIAQTWVDTDGKTHNDYPKYEARSGTDRTAAGAKVWKIADWGFAAQSQSRPATVDEIKTALFNFGPLNVSLDAGGQFGSGTGTITSLGRSIDHEIELTAWDDSDKTFMLKNQWDTSWGNGGYRKLTYAAAANLVDVFWVSVTPLPPVTTIVVVVPNGQTQVGAGYALQQIATGGVEPYSWKYDWGDTQTSTTPSHVYAKAGGYTITATATDAKGATGSSQGTVAVTADPIPPGSFSVTIPNSTAQVGVPFTIVPVMAGGTAPFTWSINYGDGTTGSSLTHTYAKVGAANLSATAIDGKGQLASAKATITVSDSPVPPGDHPTFTIQGLSPLVDGSYYFLKVEKGNMRLIDVLSPPKAKPAPQTMQPQSKLLEGECGCSLGGICRCQAWGQRCVCGSCWGKVMQEMPRLGSR